MDPENHFLNESRHFFNNISLCNLKCYHKILLFLHLQTTIRFKHDPRSEISTTCSEKNYSSIAICCYYALKKFFFYIDSPVP